MLFAYIFYLVLAAGWQMLRKEVKSWLHQLNLINRCLTVCTERPRLFKPYCWKQHSELLLLTLLWSSWNLIEILSDCCDKKLKYCRDESEIIQFIKRDKCVSGKMLQQGRRPWDFTDPKNRQFLIISACHVMEKHQISKPIISTYGLFLFNFWHVEICNWFYFVLLYILHNTWCILLIWGIF